MWFRTRRGSRAGGLELPPRAKGKLIICNVFGTKGILLIFNFFGTKGIPLIFNFSGTKGRPLILNLFVGQCVWNLPKNIPIFLVGLVIS